MVALMLLVMPIMNVDFMPREVFGVTGLNIGNIVWLVAFAMAVISIRSRKGTLRLSSYFSLPLGVFITLYLIAVIWTVFDLDAIQSPIYRITRISLIIENIFKPLQLLLVGWIVMVFCEIEGSTVPVQRVLYLVPLIIAPIEMYFFFLGGSSGVEYQEGRGSISTSIGYHANELGAVGTYLLAFMLMTKEQKIWGMVRYLSIGASLLIIALSFSRMAYVTTLVLIALVFFKLKYKERIILTALAGVVVIAFSAQLMTRIYFGVDDSIKKTDINLVSAGRIDGIWLPLMPHLFDHAVIGSGVYSILKSSEAKKGLPTHPHNAYLQVALDMGFIGVAVLLWVLARFLSLGRNTETGFVYIVICWMLMGLTGSSFYPGYANFIVWVSYGFALSVRRESLSKQNNAADKIRTGQRKGDRLEMLKGRS